MEVTDSELREGQNLERQQEERAEISIAFIRGVGKLVEKFRGVSECSVSPARALEAELDLQKHMAGDVAITLKGCTIVCVQPGEQSSTGPQRRLWRVRQWRRGMPGTGILSRIK